MEKIGTIPAMWLDANLLHFRQQRPCANPERVARGVLDDRRAEKRSISKKKFFFEAVSGAFSERLQKYPKTRVLPQNFSF